jgi:integrase
MAATSSSESGRRVNNRRLARPTVYAWPRNRRTTVGTDGVACDVPPGGRRALHLHDLRREFGSRLLESSASVHVVRDVLGHADISQTSTYLSTNTAAVDAAFKQFEAHRKDCHTADT